MKEEVKKRNSDTPFFENHLDEKDLQMKGHQRAHSLEDDNDSRL